MSRSAIQRRLEQLDRAVARLQEVLALDPKQEAVLDAAIQRFEFVFELAGKNLQLFLAPEGTAANSPRSAIREAWRAGWLQDEVQWLQILKDRNHASRLHDEETAR